MTSTPLPPSRLLLWVARCARWTFAGVLTLWVALALVWALLHGWVVPHADQWRPHLQAYAERVLGMPVRLGALHAQSHGLIPSFEVRDVAVLDASGRTALHVPRVVLALSPRSLLRAGFEQLYIEGAQLDIQRHSDGRITMGGIALSANAASGPEHSQTADWLFSQVEIVIQGATLHWRDDTRDAPAVTLTHVNLVLRNRAWRHMLRLDATPPPDWGQRFTLMGQFREPILSLHEGAWQRWSGQIYALFPHIDVAQLHRYSALAPALTQGQGAVRAWVDVQRGQARGGVLDMHWSDVNTTLAAGLKPLALRHVAGRVRASRWSEGWELSAQGLHGRTTSDLHWPASDWTLRYRTAKGRDKHEEQHGEMHASHLDLAILTHIANALPLKPHIHTALATYHPEGQIRNLHAQWQEPSAAVPPSPSTAPLRYQVKGRVDALALAAPSNPSNPSNPSATTPAVLGVQGVQGDFSFTQDGGQSRINITKGALIVPGIFEDPVLALQHLSANVQWHIDGPNIAVHIPQIRFANADAQGQAQLRWHTSDPQRSRGKGRFPGVLDVSGELTRAEGTRVHRYLPLVIDRQVRHYVRDAVRAGRSDHVQFKVQGDLYDMPFTNPEHGQFRIAAKIKDATYAYVPPPLHSAQEPPWPVLTQLAGELIFERASMTVRKASASIAAHPQLRINAIEAHIADLEHSTVAVTAQGRGPLADMLTVVNTSPLAGLTAHALAHSQGSGAADIQLALHLPISQLAQSRVRGSIALAGNSVHLMPDTPVLNHVRGAVQFSDQGFGLVGIRAQALGGEVHLEGGMPSPQAPIQIRAQGQASAEGLRHTPQLGLLAQLAQHAQGSTPYQFSMLLRTAHPELHVQTTLQGMQLDLPAPLGKTAPSRVPISFDTQLITPTSTTPSAQQDRLSIHIEGLGHAQYVRDLSHTPARVIRGAIDMGWSQQHTPSAPTSDAGTDVTAYIYAPHIDIDAWHGVLNDYTTPTRSSGPPDPAPANAEALYDYLPHHVTLRTERLQAQGRQLHNVLIAGMREGTQWRAHIDAQELGGYVQYRQPSANEPAGQVFARLSHLRTPPNQPSQIDSLLSEQPRHLPALDIVVQDVQLHGRNLGRLEIQADNRGGGDTPRQWRLSTFNLTTAHARLRSHGRWWLHSAAAQPPQRQTQINFELDIDDAGMLLERLDMPGVVRHGAGRLHGAVTWSGAPIQPDYRSMSGQMHLDIENGQFLKADPGLAKLLGVLSLQSLPRRLALDFRDVFSAGFAFDFVRGDVRIDQGIASTNNLQMKGVNAAVLMEGQANIAQETQNLHVVIVPEINAMTASLVATAINPVIGLGSFLAQAVLRGPLASAATQELKIEGTWADPHVVRLPSSTTSTATTAAPSSTGTGVPP